MAVENATLISFGTVFDRIFMFDWIDVDVLPWGIVLGLGLLYFFL